jgi:tRNA(Ile)-lysidine synthase
MKSIHAEIKAYFRRHSLPRNIRILAAASAGPDSTALVLALADLREELGFSLVLAHCDHGMRSREDSQREAAFVRALGERLEVPVLTGEAGQGKLKAAARREKKSPEAAARDFRYAFLREAGNSRSCDYIALGHTRTDRIETQIYRFFQGSSPGSLAGIPGRRGRFIRPFLNVDKTEILAFLAERGEGFCVDSSNRDTAFLRNHLRAGLLPAVRDVFPGYERALDALAEKALLYEDFVETSLAGANPWIETAEGWECSFKAFLGLHPLLRIKSIYPLYNRSVPRGGEKRIPYAFLAPLLRLAGTKADGIVVRGRGGALIRRGERLLWRTDIVLKRKKGYFYLIDGNMNFCIQERLCIRTEEVSSMLRDEKDVFFYGEGECLFIRSRRAGDTIQTGNGKKTLNKLFSDGKIGEELRDMIPVVQKNENILAVLTHPFGIETIRLPEKPGRDGGKYLRIRICEIGV